MRICQVAIPTPVPKLFDYRLPDGLPPTSVGARVVVPFGRRPKLTGVVLGLSHQSALAPNRLRAVLAVLDAEPLIPGDLLELLLWAAQYYHHPIGEVIAAALPGRLRQGLPAALPAEHFWRLTSNGSGLSSGPVRSPRQRRLLDALHAAGPGGMSTESVRGLMNGDLAVLRALVKKQLVTTYLQADVETPAAATALPLALNTDQTAALAAIRAATDFTPFLLRGVTGSGKTEVYLQAIEHRLALGQNSLVLVPEIGLTPQLVERFKTRLGVPLAVLHSGLSETERALAWTKVRAGKVPIVLGTRSAVFAPVANLGLVIVDEEHDASYKQQDGFRYSARDVAVMRASRAGVPIVLGSATPSFESLNQARSGTYVLLDLPARAAATASLPTVELLDLRRLAVSDGLSHPLRTALAECLARGEQSLLFLNRRGYAPAWMCYGCGLVVACARCDAKLTYHRAHGRLVCHHCGAERAPPGACPACGGADLHALGEGTERIESTLRRYFPEARIVRIDRDTTRRKGELEAQLKRVHAGEADILVGTQMLSKGHDFPKVTLVGVLNADQGLYSADFRGPERLFQQIVQVAGRAGRAAHPGKVLIQTYHPDHAIYTALRTHDYLQFAEVALAERRSAGFPPFRYFALLRAESPKIGAPHAFLRHAHELARHAASSSSVEVWEPVAAPMERRAGRYRAQLLVQASARKPLHRFLADWLARLAETKDAKRVRWSIDVDPIDMY